MRLKYICVAFLAISSLSSCFDLDKSPEGVLSTVNPFTSLGEMNGYLDQFYESGVKVQEFNSWGGGGIAGIDMNSDNMASGAVNTRLNGGLTLANANKLTYYTDIRNVNFFLNNLNFKDTNAAAYKQCVGEAYYFRAWFYFNLFKNYGNIAWLDHTLAPDENEMNLPQEGRTAMVDHILSDLDKAIDLLDEAGSKMNLTLNFIDPKDIDKRLIEAENLKAQATRDEDFEKAAYFRDQIAKYKELQKTSVLDNDIPIISEKTIEHIVEQKTNIPVGDLKEKEQSQLVNLASDLKAHVIGQDDAVDKIAKAIRRNRVGLGSPNRPIGSFLFVGPTGVGKTELSKQLAIELFGSADSMIRFDMSEYMEKHSVAKLVGAPPGYVGYEEAGQLTERVRRNPYSLILLDEVEKAHPDVMHMFLQVLDDGRLTDGQGRTVSFKDTIIIMTSNAGTGKAEASVGFGAAREGRTNSVLGELGNFFSPEFMNRFDGIIEFKPLSKDNLMQIVNLMLDDVNQRLATNDIHLDVTEKVKEKLVDLGYDPKMGARPLRRTIQDHIEDAITDFYLENPSEKDLKAIMTSNGKILIKSAKKSEAEKTKLDESQN